MGTDIPYESLLSDGSHTCRITGKVIPEGDETIKMRDTYFSREGLREMWQFANESHGNEDNNRTPQ